LSEPIAQAIQENDLVAVAVLSGNRNFVGRVHAQVRASFLASPPLVIAYALAGTVNIDLTTEPLGQDPQGQPVYLRDLWPTNEEIQQVIENTMNADMFIESYRSLCDGDENWRHLPGAEGELFAWDRASTYIQEPPFFQHISLEPEAIQDILGMRALVVLGDSITTDHISPAGNFALTSEAGRYLNSKGVERKDFNTYGARRGNHEVMVRGTFGNIHLRNRLTPDKEGPYTLYLPDAQEHTIYEAAVRYQQQGTPLLVIAGQEYGCGSSRDWAAKGPALLGVRVVLAESFERIHRSNLVGMGVLPLQFKPGENMATLGLTGTESFDIRGINSSLRPRQEITVAASKADGQVISFQTIARLDNHMEVSYYQQGGILPHMLRKMMMPTVSKGL
jgi:aconitate hydratase